MKRYAFSLPLIFTSLFTFAIAVQAFSKTAKSTEDSLRITVPDGTQLHVTVRGQGIPCLYIHGGPGVGSYWMEELYGDVLEKHFKMIYLDQRGSGRSGSAANGDYSTERMAMDFEEVRQQLSIESWITLSHSFGGILQIEHARLYPQHIQGMILIAATLNLNESIRQMINHSLEFLEIEKLQRSQYLDENQYPFDRLMPLFGMMRERNMFWKYHYADSANSQVMSSVMAQVPSGNYEFANKSFGLAQYYENYKPLALQMAMPALLFYGKRDYAVGPNHYHDIQFPNQTLHVWDGGHVPFIEGKQELEKSIIEWLTKIS